MAETDALNPVQYVSRSLGSSWDAPTAAQREYLDQAESLVRQVVADFNRVYEQDVARFRRQLEATDLELLEPKEALTLPPN